MTLELALEWARAGHRVLPVNGTTKRPLIKAWQQHCTTDPNQIRIWWTSTPDARVGIATGEPGFDVLDFDVAGGKPGIEQLEKLLDAGVFEPGTFIVVATPSGGRHLYFRGTDQHNKQNDKRVPGVDFRGVGGMVVAAGNPGYRYVSGSSLQRDDLKPVDWDAVVRCLAPDQIQPEPALPLMVAPQQRSPSRLSGPLQPEMQNAPGEESPLDWYVRNHSFDQELRSAGWRFAYEADGRRYWRRPGKEDEGVSANVFVNPDGRETLVNYSTSVHLPTDRGMSIAQYYAHLNHHGDMREAAKAIRTRMMPPRQPVTRIAPVALPATSHATPGMSVGAATPGPAESTPGAELVPVSEVGPPPMVRDFWTRRWEFHQIRQLARERRVSPWATLGAVLAMVTCRVGPHVVLPPIVGGVASLNLLVGLVGPSGKGKGAAWAVAEEYLGVKGKFPMEEVGTSQGIDSCFTETTPKLGSVQFNDVAFFYIPEIDTFKSHSEMAGSALLPHLRKMWSGEALGARYAKSENRRPVRAHAYRASVVAGIQPARSGVLLADVDGGTPQRWLWLPVHDPDALRRSDRLKPPTYVGTPPAIDQDVWVPEGEKRGEKNEPEPVVGKSRWVVEVCEQAQWDIIDAREQNLVNEHSSMDSHSLLTRLKIAAALAFLDRRAEVTAEDWELSLSLMWVSNATRATCVAAVADAEAEEHARRGRGRAIQSVHEDISRVVIRDERTARIQDLGGKLLGMLQSEPGREFSPRELRVAMGDAKTGREYWAEVETALLAAPGVVQGPEVSAGGRKIRKLSWEANHLLRPPSVE